MSDSPFRRVVDDLTGGCGCACHTGIGYNAACEHCQPSARTAEPRTAAGRSLLNWFSPPENEYDSMREWLAKSIAAIEAEAAAPAGLDVDLLARALMVQATGQLMQPFPGHPEHWDEHAYADEKREWRRRAKSIAAEYARLVRGKRE